MQAYLLGAAPEALIAELNTIAEATVPAPDESPDKWRPRYSPDGMDGLRRLVVSWNINPRLLDLAFLVAAVERGNKGRALDFFFSARSFTSREGFRRDVAAICSHDPEGACSIDPRGLVSRHDVRGERVLWWNRDVLMLPPLFELLCIIDLDSMTRDCEALGQDGIKAGDIGTVAGRWQRRMYDWLRKIGGASGEDTDGEDTDPLRPFTQQRMRHFSYMVKWLRARDADSPISESLDDERVLAFWRAHWPDGSVDETQNAMHAGHSQDDSEDPGEPREYRTFEHVADLAMHLWSATDAGLAQMSPHLATLICAGEDRETISEDAFAPSDNEMGADPEPLLRALESPPLAEIKFLKDTEKRAVEPIATAGAAAHRLPLTLLRAEVFGPHQRLLGRATGRPERLAELLACEGLCTYNDRAQDLRCLHTRLSVLRDCCLHVLVHLRSSHAVGRIRDTLPDLTCWTDIEEFVAGPRALRAASDDGSVLMEAFVRAFFDRLPKIRSSEPRLNDYLNRLANAFRDVNTQGFQKLPVAGAQIDGADNTDVYADGEDCLARLAVVIEGFLRTLGNRHGPQGLCRKIASDLALFQEGFTRIYAAGDPA